ncbi:hypothetical protein TIFTF001_020174 [Ficus carica]|uniref:Uncharacterized protein n=1 Tax=Ficus carica TaxID=3494 RepID=A0AA88DCE0_FICCA|nr:hypothetical protein TIFTF001_020174 [Ficus carica]
MVILSTTVEPNVDDDMSYHHDNWCPRWTTEGNRPTSVMGPSSIKRGGPPFRKGSKNSLKFAVILRKRSEKSFLYLRIPIYSKYRLLTEDVARFGEPLYILFGAHRGALGHLTSETRAATMAAEHEHQDKLPQGSPIDHQEASTSEAISQITNLTRLVEELTKKHNDQQSHMENSENQILKSQLMALNSQAAYSYYYNPYVGYSSGASAGGWRPAASYEQRGANDGTWRPATSYKSSGPINPMQPLFASEDTPVVDERQAQPRQTAPGPSSRRQTTPIRRSTPELSQSSEDLFQPGTNVEEMMRSIMSEEMRTLEAQMQQRFTSQIHKATTSPPGIDDLARGVRETPLTKRITNTITPKFSNISFPRFDGMSDPHDHLLQYKHVVQSTNIPTDMLDDMMCKLFAQSLKGAALR